MNQTEKELVEMVLAGRKDAFEPLVLSHRQTLLALATRMTGNSEDAKEIAQEALLRAYRSLRRFDTSRSFRNWLLQIAANAARDRGRKKIRDAEIVDRAADLPAGGADPERPLAVKEFKSDLMECLSVLTARERDIFILRDLEDLNIKETAEALGCSSVSVRVNLSSARRKIRDAIRARFPHLLEEKR
jgi:RNA polymerase sigma-70 factor (ECF subfamily)